MNLLKRLIVDDWRRKLMALALGFALWLWVGELISVEQTHDLRVVTSSRPAALEPGTLQVRVPQDWRLVSIEGPGTSSDTVPIPLRGSQARIEDFLATGFAATVDPELDRLPEVQDKGDVRVLPSELRWTRPDEATRMLQADAPNSLLIFRFERVAQAEVQLGPHLLRLVGEPAGGYVVLTDEIDFEPTQVRLEGPATAVGEVILGIERARSNYEDWRTGVAPELTESDIVYPLLEPLEVSERNRLDITARLPLAAEVLARGVSIPGDAVTVKVPVRLTIPDPRPDRLDEDGLFVVPDPEGVWAAPDWVPANIRYVLSSRPDIAEDVDEEWLDRHLMIFLPLNRIPDSALEQQDFELDIEWTLVGLDPATKAEVLRRLSVEFQDPTRRTVTVQRVR